MKLVCAKCGEQKELCQSVTIDNIKQPRICKDCLRKAMSTGDYDINEEYWELQKLQIKGIETINLLDKDNQYD
jgi:hypothetical protein